MYVTTLSPLPEIGSIKSKQLILDNNRIAKNNTFLANEFCVPASFPRIKNLYSNFSFKHSNCSRRTKSPPNKFLILLKIMQILPSRRKPTGSYLFFSLKQQKRKRNYSFRLMQRFHKAQGREDNNK